MPNRIHAKCKLQCVIHNNITNIYKVHRISKLAPESKIPAVERWAAVAGAGKLSKRRIIYRWPFKESKVYVETEPKFSQKKILRFNY